MNTCRLIRTFIGCDDVAMILCIPGFHQKIEQDAGDILKTRAHQLRKIEIEDVDYSILSLNRAANDPAIMGQ